MSDYNDRNDKQGEPLPVGHQAQPEFMNTPGQIMVMPNPRIDDLRRTALGEANRFPGEDPHKTVVRAEAFMTFLLGQSRELIDAEIRKWAEDRGIPFDQPVFQDGEGVLD